MLTFLGIIFGIWLAAKLFKWWVKRKLQQRATDMFEQFARAAGVDPDAARQQQQSAQKKSRKGGWKRTKHKKKIAADEGEYVEYDEVAISVDATTTNGSSTTHTHIEATERRVEDVEWEDL